MQHKMTPAEKMELKEKTKAEARQKNNLAKEQAIRTRASKTMPQMVTLPELTGDAEVDSKADLDALQEGFRQRAKAEASRFELTTDSEYWCALCFQTREQKEVFLKALDLFTHGDKYLDGQLVAERLGIKLPEGHVPYKPDGKIVKTWLEFT
ncbi:hypothetical protein [Pantoea coffeiphila]|nr:hypothetical protein [Pantoea coffeiphila]